MSGFEANQIVGSWTVVDPSVLKGQGRSVRRYIHVRCNCGNESTIRQSALGKTSFGCKSCAKTKHGLSHSREYVIWSSMKQRCLAPNHAAFRNYGGRGVKICDEWLNDFGKFLEDMGRCPDGWSINRIDNDGDYSADNCEWSDSVSQNNNTRRNVRITWKGETKSVLQWSEITGIKPATLYYRHSHGFSEDDIFNAV